MMLQLLSLFLPFTLTAASSSTNTNPYQQGCLFAKNMTRHIRVCNSEDTSTAAVEGLCRPSPMDYTEVRLVPADWESNFFGAWIIQIVLSELLHVPTSIEMGDPVSQLGLYHPDSPFDFPSNYTAQLEAIENADQFGGDCSKVYRGEGGGYQQCGHVLPESWLALEPEIESLVRDGVLEPPQDLGMLATEGWYIPKYTALHDPSLLSYLGMQGDHNRRKLARLFKRPVRWADYCRVVSSTNCSVPDEYAQRPPSVEEADNMFQEGDYTGYFQETRSNKCDDYAGYVDRPILSNSSFLTNHKNRGCSGMIVDWPCQWGSPVPGQVYHLDVGLDTDFDVHGGYSYSQLLQIWRAANATRSHVVMQWWEPESFSGGFEGTDFEFTKVTLPDTTRRCLENRAPRGNQCNTHFTERVGSPLADCGDPYKVLHSLASRTLYAQAYGLSTVLNDGQAKGKTVPEAIHSPSHAALRNYRLSDMQLTEIFALWNKLRNPRDAICNWMADNMDYVERLIPRTYPRMPVPKKTNDPLMYAATVIGALVTGLVLVTMFMVQQRKYKESIKNAQVDFLRLLLMGSLLIAIGAVIMGAPSTNTSCIVEVWAINLGYTLELVPLIVKVAAVNHVMNLGRKMRRVQIRRGTLFGVVISISVVVVAFLIAWTVIDPPQVTPEYDLTDVSNTNGETIVWVLDVCSSKSPIWVYLSVGWNGLLLVCTSVQAIRMRKVQMEGFCETPTLALLVYSHMMFVILRMLLYVLSSDSSLISEYTLARCRSLIFSLDTLATIAIYFVPKFFAKESIMRSPHLSHSHSKNTNSSTYSMHARVGTNARHETADSNREANAGENKMRSSRSLSWFPDLKELMELVELVESVDESDEDTEKPSAAFCADMKERQIEKLEMENKSLLREMQELKERLLESQLVYDKRRVEQADLDDETGQPTPSSQLPGKRKRKRRTNAIS